MPETVNETKSPKRIKRVQRLKKIIKAARVLGYALPWTISVVLVIYIAALRDNLKESYNSLSEYAQDMEMMSYEIGKLSEESTAFFENTDTVSQAVESMINPDEAVINGNVATYDGMTLSLEELYDGYRKVYLTFDDGPSIYTDEILDILKKYNVKATFFVIYKEGRENEDIYRRIVDEGHTLGMHSCTHVYADLYKDEESFMEDTRRLRNFLYLVTGVESNYYRFPGGSSNRVCATDMMKLAKDLENKGIEYYDWNISSRDASNPGPSKDAVLRNATEGISLYKDAVILFHDAATKRTTVDALPEIIEYIQGLDNTVILPITEETDPIQHISVE